jgi:hydroxymethylbilane synthase
VSKPIRIGTRGSELARWQAEFVRSSLGRLGQQNVELVIIKTEGDQVQDVDLATKEGKGFFTKEIERELLARRVDVAVHSCKDLPTEQPPGLVIAAIPERAPVFDVIVMRREKIARGERWGVPQGARVGTSSLRRRAHLLSLRRDLTMAFLRGNVPTRFGKALSGELDAVVLAEAGLTRLGLMTADGRPTNPALVIERVPLADLCPAPAQGALAIQIRAEDQDLARTLAPLNHAPTARAVTAERALLARFGGGCHLPLGVHGTLAGEGDLARLNLVALVAAPDGSERLVASGEGRDDAAVISSVHAELLRQGAERWL